MKNIVNHYATFNPKWHRWREYGYRPPIGSGDEFARSMYTAMQPCARWDPIADGSGIMHGGVFNLEFSPDGSLLVAACEKMSVLLFDPLTHKKTHYMKDAHTDCVNCVKFLDSRIFATCSDDTTIALWDVRNLKTFMRSLQGHSNWVKNIEYSVKDNLLVTSGLDGSIYTWDINSYTEHSFIYQRVFNTAGLMRCRISPDANQLVMCTTGGLIIVIHDLDLTTLAQDLQGFKPSIYRLMLATGQRIPIAINYSHLFDKKRKHNRVEIISDFPEENEAEVVSSLQIHPQGWCALSRNISHDDGSEWTCIHDIQDGDSGGEDEEEDMNKQTSNKESVDSKKVTSTTTSTTTTLSARNASSTPVRSSPRNRLRHSSTHAILTASPIRPAAEPASAGNNPSPTAYGHNDVWEALITVRQRRIHFESALRGGTSRNFNTQRITGISTGIPYDDQQTSGSDPDQPSEPLVFNMRLPPSTSTSTRNPGNAVNNRQFIPMQQNKKRLLYYIQEPNLGKGFIKELCFSSDGRLICSPFGYGARLLSFSDSCSEIFACLPEPGKAKTLVELGQSIQHVDLVVSSKFSPRHCMLVTGCLGGRIVWYQPQG